MARDDNNCNTMSNGSINITFKSLLYLNDHPQCICNRHIYLDVRLISLYRKHQRELPKMYS